jgi:hydrogenase nickel incorporation protein HypA/HybF
MLADQVLQSVLDYMKERNIARIHLVKVELGELKGLENSSLRMAYEVLSKGTLAENSKLSITRIKGIVACPACGFEGSLTKMEHEHVIDPAFHCPSCGASVVVKRGRELNITKIE